MPLGAGCGLYQLPWRRTPRRRHERGHDVRQIDDRPRAVLGGQCPVEAQRDRRPAEALTLHGLLAGEGTTVGTIDANFHHIGASREDRGREFLHT